MKAAVLENDEDVPGPVLDKLLESKRSLVVAVIDFAIIATIIWSMVFKPSF